MEERLISSETAILAKEKGFNELCEYALEGSFIHKTQRPWKNEEDPTESGVCPQSFLQKWLREEHNIHIYIVPIWNPDLITVREYWQTIISPLIAEEGSDLSTQYKTYEDSLEAALIFSLNLIK
jgi:hypothetical protein